MNVRANKILLLVTSLGSLALLGTAAYRENVRQEWRQIQHRYRASLPPKAAAAFGLRLRQIVAPALNATDRCVTCHLGMAPGEVPIAGHPLFDKHPNVGHDPADFGCTVCHSGQGRATESRAAHGWVHFWPEPMLPAAFSVAGCGACHSQLAVPNLERLEEGRAAFERHDCLACHSVDGRGGTLRPLGAGGMEGPNLSRIGATGYPGDWYERHLRRRAEGADPRWLASFGPVDSAGLAAVDIFLRSRVGAPGLVEARALFHTRGCRGCHKVAGIGGSDGVDLTHVGQLDPGRLDFTHVPGEPTLANFLEEHFRAPAKVVPGSQMPDLGLSEADIHRLTLYLLSLRRSPLPEALWPRDRLQADRFGEREYSRDGATLYGTFCAACHGPAGEGMRYAGMTPFPAVANPDFLRLASDDFLRATITQGRPGRRMAAWGGPGGTLSEADVTALIAHLRRLGGQVPVDSDAHPPRWITGDAAAGKRLFATNCARCHGENGEGKEGPALNNAVLLKHATDTYLLETTSRGRRGTSMLGFSQPSTVSQALAAGEMRDIVAFIRAWEVPQ